MIRVEPDLTDGRPVAGGPTAPAVGVVILGIFGIYKLVFSGVNVQSATQNAILIEGKLHSFYKTSQNGYTGINELVAIQANAVPPSYLTGGTAGCSTAQPDCLRSEWGGNVSIQPTDYNNSANNAFQITYMNVPASDCPDFVSGVVSQFVAVQVDTGTTGNTEPTKLKVSATDAVATSGSTTALIKNASQTDTTKQVASPAVIAAACAANGTDDIALVSH